MKKDLSIEKIKEFVGKCFFQSFPTILLPIGIISKVSGAYLVKRFTCKSYIPKPRYQTILFNPILRSILNKGNEVLP